MLKQTVLVLGLAALPLTAFGQAQYSADDVAAGLLGQRGNPAAIAGGGCPPGVPCLGKKKSRAICTGTAQECAGSAPPEPAKGFDMLITFELGSDRLSPQARENLRVFADALKDPKLSEMKLNIDGHTDARGSDALNLDLSQRRAASVVSFLEGLGVDRSRLVAQGHGESQPRDADPFAAINRRVEATIRTN